MVPRNANQGFVIGSGLQLVKQSLKAWGTQSSYNHLSRAQR